MGSDGDFMAIFRLVAKVVQWFLELTLDALCVLVLAVPLVLPWRCVALCLSAPEMLTLKGESSRVAFRCWAVAHLGAALLDMFALPFALLALLIPTRTYVIVKASAQGLRTSNDSPNDLRILYTPEVRVLWLRQFGLALCDLLCLVFGVFAAVHPWRSFFVVRGSVYIAVVPHDRPRQYSADAMEATEERWETVLGALRSWWFWNALMCFADWPAFFFGAISMLMPTRTYAFVRSVVRCIKDSDDQYSYKGGSFWDVPWVDIWIACLVNFALALLDLAVLPFSMIALVSPIRGYNLVHDIYLRTSGSPPKCTVYTDVCTSIPSSVDLRKTWTLRGGKHVYKGTSRAAGQCASYTAYFETDSTCWCFSQGSVNDEKEQVIAKGSCHTTADMVSMPAMSSPDLVTWVVQEGWIVRDVEGRIDPHFSVSAKWGFGGAPIDVLGQGNCYNQGLRLACIRHGVQALADIMFLPFMILTLVSGYRARPFLEAIRNMMRRKAGASSGRGDAASLADKVLGIRTEALRQSFLLVVDVLVSPGILLVLLSRYRSPGLLNRMGVNFDYLSLDLHAAVLKNACVLVHDTLLLGPLLLLLCTVWRSSTVCALLWPKSMANNRRSDASEELENDAVDEMQVEDSEEDPAAVARRQLAELDPEWGQLAGVQAEQVPFVGLEPPPLLTEPSFPGAVRPIVWIEFLRLLRDLACLPIMLLTLYRLPAVFIKLCSRSGRPVEGEPLFRTERMRMRVIDRGGAEIELTLAGEDSLAIDKGSLKLRPLGKAFWKRVASAFGSNVAAIAQGMMPLDLKADKTNAYEVLAAPAVASADAEGLSTRTFSFRLEAKTKRSTVVKSLEKLGDESFLVQIEATSRVQSGGGGRNTVMVAAATVRLRDTLAAAKREDDSFVDLPRSDIAVEIGEHVTVQDAFWTIVGLEFLQILLDLGHFLLLVPILIVPWRFLGLVIALFEPKDLWPVRISKKALREFRTAEWVLDRFKASFVPFCNEQLKDRAVAKKWLNRGKPPMPRSRDLDAHGVMLRSLRSVTGTLQPECGEMLQHSLDLQDARLYHVALRAYANCALSHEEVSMEEHATILEEITNAEETLSQTQTRATLALEEMIGDAERAAKGRGCKKCGFWRKDLSMIRSMVRGVAAASLIDIFGAVFFLLLILTVYRLPIACVDLARERAWNPIRNRFRIIVIWHLRAFAEEVMLATQVVLLVVLLLVTCVRIPEALHSIGRSGSLRDLRDNLLQDFLQALESLWELLSLLTLWKTYSLFFRAVGQSLLVPPACISEMIGIYCSCLPLGVKFVLGIIIVGGLLAAPFFDHAGRTIFICGMGVLLMGGCGATAKRPGDAEIQGWSSPVLRGSWANAFAFVAIFVETAFLVLTLGLFPSADIKIGDFGHGAPLFGMDARDRLCGATLPFVVTGGSLTGIWLLLVSLMFVTGQQEEYKALQTHGLLRFLQLLLSHVFSLPICLSLLLPTACNNDDYQAVGLVMLVLYVCATQALCGLLELPSDTCGLDLRYPSKYITTCQALNIAICIACVWDGPGNIIVAISLAAMLVLHVMFYGCINGTPSCCIPYVPILRIGNSLGVFASIAFVVYCRIVAHSPQQSLMLFGWLVVLGSSILAASARGIFAKRQRQMEFEKSGILDECKQLLSETEEALCRGRALLHSSSNSAKEAPSQHWQRELSATHAPQRFALQLLDFERYILVEWLTFEFLEARDEWRKALLQVRSFAELRNLISQLRSGIRSPPTQQRIMQCLIKKLKRDDVSETVLDFVVGHMELRSMLQPALFCAKSAKKAKKRCGCCMRGGRVKMDVHFAWAQSALREVLNRFKATTCAEEKLVGTTCKELGRTRMYVLDEPSHPQIYWPHLARMIQSAEKIIDTQGEPHTTLPRGLAVCRVLPHATTSRAVSRSGRPSLRLKTGASRSSASGGLPSTSTAGLTNEVLLDEVRPSLRPVLPSTDSGNAHEEAGMDVPAETKISELPRSIDFDRPIRVASSPKAGQAAEAAQHAPFAGSDSV